MNTADFLSKLGKRIKDLREERQLSQSELASKIGYDSGKGIISKIENGRVEPPISRLYDLADALDTNVAYLMGWDDNSKTISQKEFELIHLFRHATEQGQMLAIGNLQASQQDTKVG